MARNIKFEPCTLVYSLLNPNRIKFDDFYLIVRGLHNYMVESITPDALNNSVQVRLGYQASISNAINKLGGLRDDVGVSKMSSHIKENEFSRLELLRQQYGIQINSPDEYVPPAKPRGRRPRATFNPRSAPYAPRARPTPLAPADEEDDFQDAQRFSPAAENDETYANPDQPPVYCGRN